MSIEFVRKIVKRVNHGKDEKTDEYEEFISTHELNCYINNHGSAGG